MTSPQTTIDWPIWKFISRLCQSSNYSPNETHSFIFSIHLLRQVVRVDNRQFVIARNLDNQSCAIIGRKFVVLLQELEVNNFWSAKLQTYQHLIKTWVDTLMMKGIVYQCCRGAPSFLTCNILSSYRRTPSIAAETFLLSCQDWKDHRLCPQ